MVKVMVIKTKGVGLVAYIKMHIPLKGFKDGYFLFESDRSAEEWSLEYESSCCKKHDMEVMSVRNLLKSYLAKS